MGFVNIKPSGQTSLLLSCSRLLAALILIILITPSALAFEVLDERGYANGLTADGRKTVTFTFGGDVTLGCTDDQRRYDTSFERVVEANGLEWPFSGVADLLATDDITLVNFEGTLTESNRKEDKDFNFKGPAQYALMLTDASVEIVNLANNHILDYGDQGKLDTIDALDDAGVIWSAAGQTAIMDVRGILIGFVGNTFPYTKGMRDISKDVKTLREAGCAIVVASFHWGIEYDVKFSSDQRRIGRAAIDSGADIVVGHHPHIVQGIEMYKDKYIIYSLGNFVFGGNTDPKERDSFLARVSFIMNESASAVDTFEFSMIPLRTTSLERGTDYRPIAVAGSEAERIRDRVLKQSVNIESIDLY